MRSKASAFEKSVVGRVTDCTRERSSGERSLRLGGSAPDVAAATDRAVPATTANAPRATLPGRTRRLARLRKDVIGMSTGNKSVEHGRGAVETVGALDGDAAEVERNNNAL